MAIAGLNDVSSKYAILTPNTVNPTSYTWSMWFYGVSAPNGSLFEFPMTTAGNAGGNIVFFSYDHTSASYQWSIGHQNTSSAYPNVALSATDQSLSVGKWVHIVGWWDINTGLKIYRNGRLSGSNTTSAAMQAIFGAAWNGELDLLLANSGRSNVADFAFWYNRTLNDGEIKRLALQRISPLDLKRGLIAYSGLESFYTVPKVGTRSVNGSGVFQSGQGHPLLARVPHNGYRALRAPVVSSGFARSYGWISI